jgi:hypothetical protein
MTLNQKTINLVVCVGQEHVMSLAVLPQTCSVGTQMLVDQSCSNTARLYMKILFN